MLLRACAVWLAILALAFANGALRELLLIPRFGTRTGLVASGLLLSAAIAIVGGAAMRWVRPSSPSGAWSVGGLWVALTLAFEFGFGGLAQHKTWDAMLAPYLFRDGNVWPMVLVVTLITPPAFAASRARTR